MRSPNYPAVGLGEAVNLAQSVWNKEKRSFAPTDALVQAWGYSGLSGNARTKIAALRKYGLLEENGDGDLRLSELAIHALHNPTDSNERLLALREAALKPELFAELQQSYGEASDETLRSYLMTRKGFSDTGADSCIKSFRDTQEAAKLGQMESASLANTPAANNPTLFHNPAGKGAEILKPPPPLPPSEQETLFRWPLSRGVVAEVRFIGNAKATHLDLLKKYLDVAKGAMEIDEPGNKDDEIPLDRQMD